VILPPFRIQQNRRGGADFVGADLNSDECFGAAVAVVAAVEYVQDVFPEAL
jgi:hypothetical protein